MKFEDLANSSGAVQNLANAIKDFQAMVFQLLTDLPQSPRPFTIGDVRPNESIVEAPVSGIRKVRVYNTDPSKIVYLGTSSVNADTGYPLAPGGSQQFCFNTRPTIALRDNRRWYSRTQSMGNVII